MKSDAETLPKTCLPTWDIGELPEPERVSWQQWTHFIGPGIVMMGIQIGGGEWLLGPEITTRYGGGLMWIATIAILLQVFYNLECARYALYSGEPIMTGFMRTRPGPMFWVGVVMALSISALIPGLSTNAAAIIASLWLGRPPVESDRGLVMAIAYACLLGVALPVLVGGKVYNTMQWIMATKVFVVLGFCLLMGLFAVSYQHWFDVFSGFLKFGNVPTKVGDQEQVVNVFTKRWSTGEWPVIAMANIAVLGAFAGYAGGGGLANSTYSNYVRDKGWGMGRRVGAIPSAIGGRDIQLSHLGCVFLPTKTNLIRWRGWWKRILVDQWIVWAPGCFVGMALPALLSLEFASSSPIYHEVNRLNWSQAIITADGMRHYPAFSETLRQLLWVITLLVGLMVLLPSQMSIVEDFSRRWTDIIWSSNRRVRDSMKTDQVKYVYYTLLGLYVTWTLIGAWIFSVYGTPKLMTLIIANLNNVAIGITAFHILYVNTRFLPREIRPGWFQRSALVLCGVFYLGMTWLVFVTNQWPVLRDMFSGGAPK
jgi:hypothetical protein